MKKVIVLSQDGQPLPERVVAFFTVMAPRMKRTSTLSFPEDFSGKPTYTGTIVEARRNNTFIVTVTVKNHMLALGTFVQWNDTPVLDQRFWVGINVDTELLIPSTSRMSYQNSPFLTIPDLTLATNGDIETKDVYIGYRDAVVVDPAQTSTPGATYSIDRTVTLSSLEGGAPDRYLVVHSENDQTIYDVLKKNSDTDNIATQAFSHKDGRNYTVFIADQTRLLIVSSLHTSRWPDGRFKPILAQTISNTSTIMPNAPSGTHLLNDRYVVVVTKVVGGTPSFGAVDVVTGKIVVDTGILASQSLTNTVPYDKFISQSFSEGQQKKVLYPRNSSQVHNQRWLQGETLDSNGTYNSYTNALVTLGQSSIDKFAFYSSDKGPSGIFSRLVDYNSAATDSPVFVTGWSIYQFGITTEPFTITQSVTVNIPMSLAPFNVSFMPQKAYKIGATKWAALWVGRRSGNLGVVYEVYSDTTYRQLNVVGGATSLFTYVQDAYFYANQNNCVANSTDSALVALLGTNLWSVFRIDRAAGTISKLSVEFGPTASIVVAAEGTSEACIVVVGAVVGDPSNDVTFGVITPDGTLHTIFTQPSSPNSYQCGGGGWNYSRVNKKIYMLFGKERPFGGSGEFLAPRRQDMYLAIYSEDTKTLEVRSGIGLWDTGYSYPSDPEVFLGDGYFPFSRKFVRY